MRPLRSIGNRLYLVIRQGRHLAKGLDLPYKPLLLARRGYNDPAMSDLVSPLHQYLIFSRIQLFSDLLDDWVYGSPREVSDGGECSVGSDGDALVVTPVDDGFRFIVNVRVDFNLGKGASDGVVR